MPEYWWLICCGVTGPIIMVIMLLFFQGTPVDSDETGAQDDSQDATH